MTIDEWQDRVAALWHFDVATYPLLRRGGAALADGLQHIALHQAKDAGRIAAAVEPADHGREIDYPQLQRATRNALVNALRLCAMLSVPASSLLADYTKEFASPDGG